MDSVVPALLTMGTLGGTKMDPDLVFDGSAKQWPIFKSAMLKLADSKNLGYMLEGGHGICAIFQAASAAAARATTRSATATATISLDITTYNKKEIEEEFKKTSVLTSVALAVRQNTYTRHHTTTRPEVLTPLPCPPPRLSQPKRVTVEGGGKRMRYCRSRKNMFGFFRGSCSRLVLVFCLFY